MKMKSFVFLRRLTQGMRNNKILGQGSIKIRSIFYDFIYILVLTYVTYKGLAIDYILGDLFHKRLYIHDNR